MDEANRADLVELTAEIISAPSKWVAKKVKRSTIGYAIRTAFGLLAAIDVVGVVVVGVSVSRQLQR